MNNSLLNIVKRIVAVKGENVLADPKKLRPLFKDYAKDEPKEDRVSFGRCIEIGSYQELKNANSADERQRKKAALADQLNAKYGIDKMRCADALDLLEAVIINAPIIQNDNSPSANPTKKLTIGQQIISFLSFLPFLCFCSISGAVLVYIDDVFFFLSLGVLFGFGLVGYYKLTKYFIAKNNSNKKL